MYLKKIFKIICKIIAFILLIPLYFLAVYAGFTFSVVLGILGFLLVIIGVFLPQVGYADQADMTVVFGCAFFMGILPSIVITVFRILIFSFGFNLVNFLFGDYFSGNEKPKPPQVKRPLKLKPVSSGALNELNRRLKNGEITKEEYDIKLHQLSTL